MSACCLIAKAMPAKCIPYCMMFGYTRTLFPNMLVDGTGAIGSKPTYRKLHVQKMQLIQTNQLTRSINSHCHQLQLHTLCMIRVEGRGMLSILGHLQSPISSRKRARIPLLLAKIWQAKLYKFRKKIESLQSCISIA